MANTGKTVATLLIGAAIGAAVGYIVAMDDDKRKESLGKIKNTFNDLKDKVSKKGQDLEHDIYNS